MAKIKLSGIITDIRGKIGGSVFQQSQGGLVLKNKSNPTKTPTSSQSASINTTAIIQSAWISLSTENKIKWDQYAAYVRLKQKSNKSIAINGQQLFIKYNYYLHRSEVNIILNPIWSKSAPIVYTFTLTAQSFRIYFRVVPYPLPSSVQIIAFLSRPMSKGIISFPTDLRLMNKPVLGGLSVYYNIPYLAAFGQYPKAGSAIFFKVSIFNKYSVLFQPWTQGRVISS